MHFIGSPVDSRHWNPAHATDGKGMHILAVNVAGTYVYVYRGRPQDKFEQDKLAQTSAKIAHLFALLLDMGVFFSGPWPECCE